MKTNFIVIPVLLIVIAVLLYFIVVYETSYFLCNMMVNYL